MNNDLLSLKADAVGAYSGELIQLFSPAIYQIILFVVLEKKNFYSTNFLIFNKSPTQRKRNNNSKTYPNTLRNSSTALGPFLSKP